MYKVKRFSVIEDRIYSYRKRNKGGGRGGKGGGKGSTKGRSPKSSAPASTAPSTAPAGTTPQVGNTQPTNPTSTNPTTTSKPVNNPPANSTPGVDPNTKKQILDEAAGKGENAAKDAAENAGKKGEQAAKQSEGFLTRNAAKVENWYKGLSKTGKAGVIGAGLLGVGLAGYGAASAMNKKDRAYSYVNSNNMYNVRRFSMEDEARARREARRGLRLQDSHRGLGRSLLLGGPEGAYGAYISKGGVDEDYENGLSEAEIVNNAANRGAKWGAGIGGGFGLLGGTAKAAINPRNPRNAIAPITYGSYGAIGGGLGGYFGAKKNARTRLDKPRVKNYD